MQENKSTLQYLVKEPKVQNEKTRTLILLHGVGSNEQDLFNLSAYLPEDIRIISARAPITLGNNSYAWYQVDFSTGKPVYNPQQEQSSRKAIIYFIGEIKSKYKLSTDQLYLGGFSQGAIMSYSVALTNPHLVAGIIVMSGRLPEEIKPSVAPKEKLKNLEVFMSHGTKDNVLPVAYARDANQFLKSLDIETTYNEYPEGHGINAQMLADLNKWFNRK